MFGWMDYVAPGVVAHAVLALSIVVALGLLLGALGFRGIRLGTAGVLFVGLMLGQAGLSINHDILEFVRDFGLILFVYTVGLQVGPSFFSSLKRRGLQLNALALSVVILGALIVAGYRLVFHFPLPVVAGLFSGATTNTPSLAAGQAALQNLKGSGSDSGDYLGMAYAVAYPFGVVGIILTMLLIQRVFRVDVETESASIDPAAVTESEAPGYIDLEVTNPGCDGMALRDLPLVANSGVVFSRLYRDGKVVVPEDKSVLCIGDSLRLVGPRARLSDFETVFGRRSRTDLSQVPSELTVERLYVTKSEVLGKSLKELNFEHYYGSVGTRIVRAGVEFAAGDPVRLQFGDILCVVGPRDGVAKVAELVGNKAGALNDPHVLPVFIGIMLGVVLGSLPIALPGMPAPVRLGLAGGPLLIALGASQLGRLGPLVCYMSPGANLALREIGIVLFLACVGLKSGGRFLEMLFSQSGLSWLVAGAVLTLVPLLLVALFARGVLKMDYPILCGILAGSMTDPPALAFASSVTKSDRPLIAYAAVYPLVMILRVCLVQVLILTLPT
ncbi:MAG TPA: putative transporter [Chthoniobacterales bacterium]|nr:putative transporter [Chthoniobacterales bacterium]